MSHSIRSARALCGAAVIAILSSCAVSQTIVIRNDGSGTLAMHAEVTKLLHDYLASLSEVSGKPALTSGGAFFDVASIRKDFESRPGITVVKVVAPSPDAVDLELGYESIQNVFARDDAMKTAGAFAYSESNGKKTIRLHLDRSNYTQLASLFPLLRDPTIAALGPQVNDTITDDEYVEMIRFSLGDEGPPLLKKSFITLTIDPEGEILSQSGGVVNGGAVTFRIPLLRLLVLDKPLEYAVTFR